MKFAQQASSPARTRISLTPLIDVVFILLLFFMLTSTFADRRTLDLATPAAASIQADTDTPIVLELTADGLLHEGRPLPVERVGDALRGRLTAGDTVILSVATGIDLETSVTIMDALKASGARTIALHQAEASQ